jgi:pyridoxamine 5'-phosphate oxidase
MNIQDIRTEYKLQTLNEVDVNANPLLQFQKWFEEAVAADIVEVNAFQLATASANGVPSVRTVLLKGLKDDKFIFYTNYNSQKGTELAENPRASALFFYKELERQIRITGIVNKISTEDSDAYFYSRPKSSQIGAIASPQSEIIESRAWLEEREAAISANSKDISRPEHWGGYAIQPVTMEFWQGRPSRLHDRILYTLQSDGSWSTVRLAP